MHEFPSPHNRIRKILDQALPDTTYVSSRLEGDRVLYLEARRGTGRHVHLRFHGLRDSEATAEVEPGAELSVKSVGDAKKFSLFGSLTAIFKPPGPAYARVRIDAGATSLDIVCQDVEWWED